MVKYSEEFLRDVRWFLKMRNFFNFDGSLTYCRKWVKVTKRDIHTNEIKDIITYPMKTWEEVFPHVNLSTTASLYYLGTDSAIPKPDIYSKGSFFNYYFEVETEPMIVYDKKGIDGIEAFFRLDSQGKIFPTKHPNILYSLLKTKGSINLHIKMYAEDRASQLWGSLEFRALCIKLGAPDWFRKAVETQKYKYIK